VIICDTGPLVAAALSSDADHRACVDLFSAMHEAGRQMLVPAPVVAEVGYLLAREVERAWSHCSCDRWPMATSCQPS
jgi:predicted nucleic acid-binding protein